jgi:hypothetical protein
MRVILATIFVAAPPIIFEKITYYYYSIASSEFGTFSVDRFWFDIGWFCVAGAVSAVIAGRDSKAAVLPSLFGSLAFTVVAYIPPLCTMKECYFSSPDGLGPVRDFLFFGALGVITSAAMMKSWRGAEKSKFDLPFQLGVTALAGFALSFFPVTHIFAGVSDNYPLNYLQWFLAGAPAGLAGSMWLLDRGTLRGIGYELFAGLSGVILAVALSVILPCEDCSGYSLSVVSIILLAATFCIPAILLEFVWRRQNSLASRFATAKRVPAIITASTIVVVILLLVLMSFEGTYQMSVVNSFSGVSNSDFSQLEVGHTFVYSGGYLAIPRVVSQSVGINVSFGNTSISEVHYPGNFLAAGVGDQSPNCCKDGLDLAYRADAIEFSNGTEAVLARAWWACDYVMACGGYSWQQLLHIGWLNLPSGALSNWVELRMNWTSSGDIQWFYRLENKGASWILYDSFVPPKIQNHYWDAGLLGAGNPPIGYALFFQFGVSSAYPINNGNWQVYVQCPNIVLNGVRECLPAASYINGMHSFWKIFYTFGATYFGMTFTYMGNHEVKFYYSGHSPRDETIIWS